MNATWKIVATLLAVLAAPAVAAEHFFDSDGVQIRYTNDGEGDPIVLVHGYQATGDLNWKMNGVVRLLQTNYRVITMDVRGHGKSADASDDAYGIAAVHDVIRLMDHLGIEKAHIGGYSMGGMITIKALTLYPERFKSAMVGGMGWVEPGSITPRTDNLDDKYTKIYNAFDEYSTTAAEMQAIETPLQVIVGDEDHGQLRRVSRWQAIVPDLDVVYVEGASHINCNFRPAFREGIKAFFDAHSE